MRGWGVALARRVAGVGRGGPWLVAAGPLASRRHPAASPSPAQRQLIDRRQPCPNSPAH